MVQIQFFQKLYYARPMHNLNSTYLASHATSLLQPHLYIICDFDGMPSFYFKLTHEGPFSPGWSHQPRLNTLLVRDGANNRDQRVIL